MAHYLFSQDQDTIIETFETFDKEKIKESIINHLSVCPLDTLEHCKDYSKKDIKRFYGYQIINFYRINPKNKLVSKIITRNGKEYYQKIQ